MSVRVKHIVICNEGVHLAYELDNGVHFDCQRVVMLMWSFP